MVACQQKQQEPVVTPWGQITDTIPTDDDFDLDAIQRNGELIALTLTGPETYYDYHGRHLGTQYMLAQRFADKIGVMLRMEVCRDSAEMLQRLNDGEADLICYPLAKQGAGWIVPSKRRRSSFSLLVLSSAAYSRPCSIGQGVSSRITMASSSVMLLPSVGTGA